MMKAKLMAILATLLAVCIAHIVPARSPIDIPEDGLPENGYTTGLRYYNKNTSQFYVPGTSIPDVDFDVGESYAGLLPISSNAEETRELFFWFFPSNITNFDDLTTTNINTTHQEDGDLVIWLNGGPGCSSLEGLLQENGPFSWKKGTWRPVPNPYSWNRLANMLWVEQPVGTGYTRGAPNIANEADLARQFLGFLELWLSRFNLRGRRVFVTGESYAGVYVPYIVDAMYARNDTALFNPRGLMIYDPLINQFPAQADLPAVPFVDWLAPVFGLNASFMGYLHEQHRRCGFEAFLAQNLLFPPTSFPLPSPPPTTGGCDLWDQIFEATLLVNPCFSVYGVTLRCPLLWDVLGFPGSFQLATPGTTVYFNRSDVQRALHVGPPYTPWSVCAPDGKPVFPQGDGSLPSGLSVLPRLIERNERTVVAHGSLDYILIANGTLLTIQNMTWAGRQGFQTRPGQGRMVVPFEKRGDGGVAHEERGLTWVFADGSGHMVPEDQPGTGLWMLAYLLGFAKSLDGGE